MGTNATNDPRKALREALATIDAQATEHVEAIAAQYDAGDPTGAAGDAVLVQMSRSKSSSWSGGPASETNIIELIEREACLLTLERRIESRRFGLPVPTATPRRS